MPRTWRSKIPNALTSADVLPIDLKSALMRAMGDSEFLATLLEQFETTVPDCVEVLKKALADGDGEALQSEAHRLKGAASNLSIDGVAGAAYRLELMGAKRDLSEAVKALGALNTEFRRLQAFLQSVDWSQVGAR